MRVTAAGSLPGDDFRGAVRAMSEALPDVLPLPELGLPKVLVGALDQQGITSPFPI